MGCMEAFYRTDPGRSRRTQNWIGGNHPGNALFVPPPVNEMNACLDDLEKFMHEAFMPIRDISRFLAKGRNCRLVHRNPSRPSTSKEDASHASAEANMRPHFAATSAMWSTRRVMTGCPMPS
jgi:hypothetical protein